MSSCHKGASIRVVLSGDGTNYYECLKCYKPCDPGVYNSPKQPIPASRLIFGQRQVE